MEILKEKLGNAILPLITQFVDQISKPGGLVDQVGKFLDNLSNPKTDAGQLFQNIKDAVGQTVGAVKNFFALFGNGDAMKGFSNVVTGLIRALPALLALKGILILAETGAALKNLALAIGMIETKNVGGGGGGNPFAFIGKAVGDVGKQVPKLADIGKVGFEGIKIGLKDAFPLLGVGNNAGTLTAAQMAKMTGKVNSGDVGVKEMPGTTININVHSADPKAVVDAVGQYVKTNGGVPSSWNLVTKNGKTK